MSYTVRLTPTAKKHLAKIPKNFQDKIKVTLVALQNDPFLGKRLFGKYKDQYSINVWPYRIIYEIHKNILLIIVLDIGHRQGVYK
ncbi:MAG: hypothetical protein A3B10_03595 [Candidatus Doudnabacteria bacterium RIFCSPLOWO2_01_FULL_44_21]|uniref:Addiction module toxin RelE n=1 Tax=Candidatus Doudnabacteria bacterium RIFCSPLOWO2_01_FULL_44_21 TaxID=1817841 RepID=A0A1F5PYC8_9BACT|nr:MAG: hypothetical protein A3B95_02250 [Candidatus Doudnabacteria bacterium RIFCSPHIGHO2_02_FULL_43_13b]OGE94847.1 MAG: hypothetical protein A3B10_03595 [Candidatus Doudnabacteria bacterium RIFCSPLOWO2_01_FULL_44_21]